jgi:hypothetical protein
MRWLAVFAAFLTLAGSQAAYAARPAALRLVRSSPLTLHGANFRARERVRVVVVMDTRRWSARTRAGAKGSFTVRFARVTLNFCATPLTIVARGERSGTVRARIPPRECAAP